MVLFNKRKMLEDKYKEFLENNKEVKDCPLSVITFLEMNSILDEDEVNKFLEESDDYIIREGAIIKKRGFYCSDKYIVIGYSIPRGRLYMVDLNSENILFRRVISMDINYVKKNYFVERR